MLWVGTNPGKQKSKVLSLANHIWWNKPLQPNIRNQIATSELYYIRPEDGRSRGKVKDENSLLTRAREAESFHRLSQSINSTIQRSRNHMQSWVFEFLEWPSDNSFLCTWWCKHTILPPRERSPHGVVKVRSLNHHSYPEHYYHLLST